MQHAGWRSRGYIPHCDAAGIIQHIVIRTISEAKDGEPDGQHFFKNPEAATIIESTLLHFDGDRYRLLAWCVMSNHVHIIAQQLEGWPLATVVHSWKSFTANEANRVLARNGPLWQREYFDRFMRNDDHLGTTIAYVENNPVAAGLVETPQDWRWSSARLRVVQAKYAGWKPALRASTFALLSPTFPAKSQQNQSPHQNQSYTRNPCDTPSIS